MLRLVARVPECLDDLQTLGETPPLRRRRRLLHVRAQRVRKCHDITSLHAGGFLRWLPFWVPFDKNIVFHKACAKYYIWVSVFGHATAHYYNYGFAPYYNAVFTAAGLESTVHVSPADCPGARQP